METSTIILLGIIVIVLLLIGIQLSSEHFDLDFSSIMTTLSTGVFAWLCWPCLCSCACSICLCSMMMVKKMMR